MSNLRDFLPPVLVRLLLRFGAGGNTFKYGYKSWVEAASRCTGYDAATITEAIVRASKAVRDKKAKYERDGVLFDEIQHSWPLLAAILGAPKHQKGVLRVLDWGGSLGSTYRQNQELLEAAGLETHWVIIEQDHIVEIGKNEFQTDNLSFVSSTKELEDLRFDVVLFASSLCYLESPDEAIREALELNPARIVIDRTPETTSPVDLIGVQRAGKGIYKASYPVHAFSSGTLAKLIGNEYVLISEWLSDLQPDPQTFSKGYVFQRVSDLANALESPKAI